MPFRDEDLDMLRVRRSELQCELAHVEQRIRRRESIERAWARSPPRALVVLRGIARIWMRWWPQQFGVLFVTLASIAAVLVQIALVVGAPCHGGSRIDRARWDAQIVRSGAEMYLAQNPRAACPCVHDLIDQRILNASVRTTDPWNREFLIECDREDVAVISSGPDGRFGTEDDVQ